MCFRDRGGDETNERILERVNASGRLYMTHTKLDSRFTLRISIGQTNTTSVHVENAWELIRAEAPNP